MLKRKELHPRREHFLATCGPLALLALLMGGCGEASGRLLGGQLPGTEIPSWEHEIEEKTAIELRVGRCGDGIAQIELIDDMEDGDDSLSPIAGRTGNWFSFNDESSGAEQEPPMGAQLYRMAQLDSPRGSSRLALHTFGSGYTDWGAGVGLDFLPRAAYDAARYAGIAFWARRVGDKPALPMRINVSDRSTSHRGGVCDLDCKPNPNRPSRPQDKEDGVCEADRGPCFDDFGIDLEAPLSNDWKFLSYPWELLTTVDWTEKHVTTLVRDQIYGIRIQVGREGDASLPTGAEGFDFWIDDTYFLCPLGKWPKITPS